MSTHTRTTGSPVRPKLLLALAALVLAGAAPAQAATWNPPVSYTPASSGGGEVQIASDPLGGPTLVGTNNGDTQLLSSDLSFSSSSDPSNAAWSSWTQVGADATNNLPGAQPWPSPPPDGRTLPISFSEGVNGDAVAAWMECTGEQAQQDQYGNTIQMPQGCVLKAALRPSGSTWDAPVTVDDGTSPPPGDGTDPYPPIALVSSTGGPTQVRTAVDGSGNATILWGQFNSGDGEFYVARTLLSDGTDLTAASPIGYVAPPQIVASQNPNPTASDEDLTIVYPDGTGSNVDAISPTLADVQSGNLPGPNVVTGLNPDNGWGAVLGLASDGSGHATILAYVSPSDPSSPNGDLATASETSAGSWGTPKTVATSVGSGYFAPSSWLVEDAAGDASVLWLDSNNDGLLSDVHAGGASWSAPQTVADGSHPVSSYSDSLAMNSAGDLVVAWTSIDSSHQNVVYARVRPAGGSFDNPTQLGGEGTVALAPVINNDGVATVVYGDSIGAHSQSSNAVDPGGTGGGGGGPLSSLGKNPGAPTLNACKSTAKMPSLTGLDRSVAVPKLEDPPTNGLGFPFAHVAVIERHPTNPPSNISKNGFGDVYSQTPAAGKTVNPCTGQVRLVVYGGPSGVSASDYKSLKGLVGQSLTDALNLGSTWHIDWHFHSDSSLTNPKVTQVVEISLRARQIEVDVAMPTNRTDYQGRVFQGGPFTRITLPSVGADGDLSKNMRNVFGASVWSGAAPVDAQLIMDTHDVGNNETRGSGFAEDNIVEFTDTSQTLSSGEQVRYLKDAAVLHVTPLSTGDIYIVADWPCADSTCYAFDDIPVVDRSAGSSPQPWDSFNGYRYAPNGDLCGTVKQQKSYCYGAAHDVSRSRRTMGFQEASGSCDWRTLWCFFGLFNQQDQTPTPGTDPAPVTAAKYDPLACSPGSTIGKLANGTPITCGPLVKVASTPVYDFGLGMYPMLYSKATGLDAGHVYKYVGGKAIDLLDGTTHDIIAAGGGNAQDELHLQANEIFGVYGIVAAGGGNIISAGSGNIIAAGGGNITVNLHWPVLNADNYDNLAPGMYQINRPDGPDGNVVATPVKYDSGGNIIAAGGGNIIAAGGGNIIAAGAGNLANGYYNIIAAGGGNIIAAGGGNIIAAGGGNVLDYNSIMTMLPTSQSAADAMLALANGPTMTGKDNAHLYGGTELSSSSLAIPSLAHHGQGITAGGDLFDLSKVGSLGKIDLNRIIAAGGGNIIAAGGGNIIAAGGGNLASTGVS